LDVTLAKSVEDQARIAVLGRAALLVNTTEERFVLLGLRDETVLSTDYDEING